MWRDDRTRVLTGEDVYLQRVTATGTIAPGWPPGGLPVCDAYADQLESAIVPDDTGGALMVWLDYRNGGTGGTSEDLYAQRILADGSIAPGWPINGAPVSRGPDFQDNPAICSDGAGGMYVVWQDWRNYPLAYYNLDVYAQHLTAAGVPAPGWPADGLPVCTLLSPQGGTLGAVPDGSGGVVTVWNDLRSGVIDIYAQHLLADGTIAPGWVADGVPVVPGRTRTGVLGDGAGGFYVPCATLSGTAYGSYYVQRFTFSGTRAPGWPEGGVLACDAPGTRDGLQFSPDGQGGVLLAWYDYRPPDIGGEIYVTRVLADGTRAPGWTADGTRMSDPAIGPEYINSRQGVAPDGLGGAYVVWERQAGGIWSFVQHLTAQGAIAPGWPMYGIQLNSVTAAYQFDAAVTSDGAGGAIVAWDDGDIQHSVWAQRFVTDGPVAVEISLVSAAAMSDRVTLVWQEAGDRFPATVYRRESVGDWAAISRLDPDGEGMLRYEDRDVTPGARYGYRLGILENGVERLLGETSIEVPAISQLALRGVSPNPAVRDLNVAFSLPGSAPARLELIDIAGRRVRSEEVGSLGAGNHVLNVNRDGQLAAGVYLVRLSQGARSATARAIVVR